MKALIYSGTIVSIVLNLFLIWYIGLIGEDTIQSPGYSDLKFIELKCNMTTTNVENILGKPLQIVSRPDLAGEEIWIYTAQASQTSNYDHRSVRFNKDGKVESTMCYRYFD